MRPIAYPPPPPRAEDDSLGSIMLAIGLLLVAILGVAYCSGCTRTAQLEALTVLTRSATAAAPDLIETIQAEEDKCFDGGRATYAEADACVDASRARWGIVLSGYDTLAALDQAALDGTVDVPAVVAAYCALSRALPSLAALPAALGVCQ